MMKNKKLIVAVGLIMFVLIVNFFTSQKDQPQVKHKDIPEVGILQYVSHPALDKIYEGMIDELTKEGFIDGETISITKQNAQADQSKLTNMGQQLISKHPDVLVGIATPAAQSLANQTTDIPIVLGAISDPKAAGLVASNENPGGNITGVSDQAPVEAQVALMKQLVPQLKTVGVLYSSAEDNSLSQVNRFTDVAKKEGLQVKHYPVPSTNEIAQMSQVMTKEVDAIYIPTDNTIANGFQTVVSIADVANIPIFPSVDTMVDEGGVATVGINQYDLGVETGKMVSDLLNDTIKTEDTPIYIFETGDLIINEEKVNQLGIHVPVDLQEEMTK